MSYNNQSVENSCVKISEEPNCETECRQMKTKQCVNGDHVEKAIEMLGIPDSKDTRDYRLYVVSRARFRRNFYLYARKKTKGALIGAVDGFVSAATMGAKWTGAGGFIVGSIATMCGACVGGICGPICGFLYGVITNEDEVTTYWRHYRETFGIGDNSGQHGTWS